MNWIQGFLKAGALFAVSGLYTVYAVGAIMWLGGWGLVPSLVPVFGLAAAAFANEEVG